MSFGQSAALQGAIFGALTRDAVLAGLVGDAIYDAVPLGTLPDLYVRMGTEDVRDASDISGAGAEHRLTVTVITTQPGFTAAKVVAGAVSDVLHDAALTLARGRLSSLRFERAQVKRTDSGEARQIDLRFRARVEDVAP